MKKSIGWVLVVGLLITTSGCMTVHLSSGAIDKPVMMTSPEEGRDFAIVKHFNHDMKGFFTIFNLVTVSNPKVQKFLQDEINSARGDAVINVRIKGQTTFVDGLVPVALGIIGTIITPYGGFASNLIGLRTYTVVGDVIRYRD